MATKKTGKTNKTAHVLNVLAGAGQDEAAETSQADASEAEVSPKKQAAHSAVLEVSGTDDDVLADTIRDTLQTIEFDEEEASPESTPEPAAEQIPESEPEPTAISITQEVKPVAETNTQPITEEENPVIEKMSVAAEPPIATVTPVRVTNAEASVLLTLDAQETIGYVNIMQALVEEKAPKYLKMFNICPCPRCTADVKAIALSHLPAQYAVMEKSDVIPMLTVYEGRHNSILTAQIIKACELVSSKPRHK